jgi:hypothetical protein
MSGLALIPITLRRANDFVAEHHRHSGRTARNGGKFAVGVTFDQSLIGVAIVGNPVSATYMDGFTAEVLRVCVSDDAPKNACSFLYGRCWRIWQQMGGRRLITYTLLEESGSSLKGAGWKVLGSVKPHKRWTQRNGTDGLERQHKAIYDRPKLRWEAA